MTSNEIDKKIVDLFRNGSDIYVLKDHVLKDLKPDLIVAQGICEVCSPFTKEIRRAVSILGYSPEIIILDPHYVKDILNNIMDVAKKIDKLMEGNKLVKSICKKINVIQNHSKKKNVLNLQRILCLEWINPFFTAGHWIPEMVEIAGGMNGLSNQGERSRRTSLEEIKKFDPDKIILMPCGFGIDRTIYEYGKILKYDSSWNSLRAVKEDEIYVVDAGSYFSKPGPRTFIGVEILSNIINPYEFNHISVPPKAYLRMTV
jgi:iron complex transport system substrate-binding protein